MGKEMKEKFEEANKKKKMYQKKYQELKKESDTRPCPNGIIVGDDNIKNALLENSSDKETIKCFDTSLVTNMNNLFAPTDINADTDISSWDVSSVTDMADMFRYAEAKEFNSDVSEWDVSSVMNMKRMFYKATEFNSDVSDWDVSSVTDMVDMFDGSLCSVKSCIECPE